jgi:NAD(P)H-hydrate epimerase
MQAIEQEANALGLTYETMMENAGRGLAEIILDEFGYLEEAGTLGLVGSGNNGGDTLVTLASLAEAGWPVTACLTRPRPQDDPLVRRLLAAGGKLYEVLTENEFQLLSQLVQSNRLILDGVLGTGFHLPLKPDLGKILEVVRSTLADMREAPVVIAVDCPSGIDCDTGKAARECIPADMTVTMAAYKQGLLKFPAFSYLGETRLTTIGLPMDGEALTSWRSVQSFIADRDWVHANLPARPQDAHKGTFGTAFIVAGSISYTGAAYLAGKAAYRAGAGLVTLAVPSPLHAVLAGQFPEATWVLLPHLDGFIANGAEKIVLPNLGRATSLLIGPGFGLEETTRNFLSNLLEQVDLPPLVIDADGLKLLTGIAQWARRIPGPAVLTPHPGEMSILTGLSREAIQENRLQLAQQTSREWGHVVVLKGAFTVIAAPDGQTAVIPVATPALARAGTGDVLAGLIAGLRAQGMPAFNAAAAGAWIHAFSGLAAADKLAGTRSILAGDVLEAVPEVISGLD